MGRPKKDGDRTGDGLLNDSPASGSGEQTARTAPENAGTPPAPETKPAKKRVRHGKLKGRDLITGSKTIAFDADGIAEADAADAEWLLSIPGYTEVTE
jgi:hypothetical protein